MIDDRATDVALDRRWLATIVKGLPIKIRRAIKRPLEMRRRLTVRLAATKYWLIKKQPGTDNGAKASRDCQDQPELSFSRDGKQRKNR